MKGDWLEWQKQMHCFPLMFPFHVREAVDAIDWIIYARNTGIMRNKQLLANTKGSKQCT